MSEEMLRVARELQACEVRLGLLGDGNGRRSEIRRELEEKRDAMKQRLAQLEAAHGWSEEPGGRADA